MKDYGLKKHANLPDLPIVQANKLPKK